MRRPIYTSRTRHIINLSNSTVTFNDTDGEVTNMEIASKVVDATLFLSKADMADLRDAITHFIGEGEK